VVGTWTEGTQGDHYLDLQGLILTLIHPHHLRIGVTSGAGTAVAITCLGFRTLHVLRITGTTGQVVDLQAQMCANLRCHQSPMGMDQLLYPAPDNTMLFGMLWNEGGRMETADNAFF